MIKKPLAVSYSQLDKSNSQKQKAKSALTMEELLASQTKNIVHIFRGQQVEGEIVSITDREITLDLGAKSEGVLATRGIPNLKDLKVGSKLKAFVYMQENESGQTVLSLQKQVSATRFEGDRTHLRGGKSRGGSFRGGKSIDWFKFIQAKNQKSKFQGSVAEVNKGGLIVEVGGVRGFLPNSQVGFELLSKSGEGMENLIGQDLAVTVIEVDADNNKLIFSERGQVSDETMEKLKTFKTGQKVKGKIKAILPFGLIVSVNDQSSSGRDVLGLEGLVFISDVSWDKVDDLSKDFKVGQEPEVLVLGLDEELGRLNLSIKQLSVDPFEKIAENYPVDEVVKGTVTAISDAGVMVGLEGVEGFLPASKMSPETAYEVGKTLTLLVDSVDTQRRRINLAPFVTSTAGLIYK